MKITQIKEYKKAIPKLQSNNLIPRYKKAAKILLSGNTKIVDFKLRKPKEEKIRLSAQ